MDEFFPLFIFFFSFLCLFAKLMHMLTFHTSERISNKCSCWGTKCVQNNCGGRGTDISHWLSNSNRGQLDFYYQNMDYISDSVTPQFFSFSIIIEFYLSMKKLGIADDRSWKTSVSLWKTFLYYRLLFRPFDQSCVTMRKLYNSFSKEREKKKGKTHDK